MMMWMTQGHEPPLHDGQHEPVARDAALPTPAQHGRALEQHVHCAFGAEKHVLLFVRAAAAARDKAERSQPSLQPPLLLLLVLQRTIREAYKRGAAHPAAAQVAQPGAHQRAHDALGAHMQAVAVRAARRPLAPAGEAPAVKPDAREAAGRVCHRPPTRQQRLQADAALWHRRVNTQLPCRFWRLGTLSTRCGFNRAAQHACPRTRSRAPRPPPPAGA